MAKEYHVTFSDKSWYERNRYRLAAFLRALERFVREVPPSEFWLKDEAVANSWAYDMRVFLKSETIEIEVSSATRTLSVDVAAVLSFIEQETVASLVDDDGIPFDVHA